MNAKNVCIKAIMASPEIAPEMVVIPSGEFMMGSEDDENCQPIHQVTIKKFAMGKTPVTQGQWEAVMGNKPNFFRGHKYPVDSVSWHDTQEFILKINAVTGQEYRLPSEAEWEYACRAGSTGKWCFGDDYSLLKKYAWYRNNRWESIHKVGQKLPNAFGLYDMHGNVWEWCEDLCHTNYHGAPIDGSAWMTDPFNSYWRVIRGGSWVDDEINARSYYRGRLESTSRNSHIGFRLAKTLP